MQNSMKERIRCGIPGCDLAKDHMAAVGKSLREKESRVVLSVKMVSQHQSKDSGSKKNEGEELKMVAPQDKSSKKMKFASSSAETEPTSQTTISDDSKTGRGMSTMPRVVKRKLQKLRPIVEYNKMGKGIGQAHSEMQSCIGVLARSKVPLVDKKWSEIPKDIKEQIWEAVDMAFVVGQGGKNSVLSSAAKKWKDFKSTLTRHYILPYTNDKEKLSQPPETYKFIEKAQWDAFVASRLSKDFESVHSQHAQIREKLEYNHRLSRKGYAALEDELEETMPGVEIDRSTLWKRARQDKHGNIPDPKVAEKAKIIDELQKQVSEGKVSVYGSNDVLTMALGPEHPGRVRAVGSGISPRQYFNLPKPQRVSFDDRLKDSLRVLLQEETKKMEAKAREEALRMEARTKQLVEAEREHFLSQLSQLIPNFDPSMLKPRISQSPKNPMSDKASCSGGDGKHQEEEKKDTAKNGKHQEDEEKEEEKKEEEKEEEKEKEDEEKHDDKVIEVGDYLNVEAPSSLKTLCRYVETTLMPEEKILQFTIDKEMFGRERDTFLLPEDITQFAGMEEIGATVVAVYMRYLHDVLKKANMTSMVGFIDPATVSANSGTIADRSRLVAGRLQKTDGEQIFMMPYNPSRHWVLLIVRAKRETVYFLDPLPGHRVVDEEAKNIVNSAIKIYNSHIGRAGRKAVQSELEEDNHGVSENLRWLAAGPNMAVPLYRSYLIKGIKFNIKAQDDVRTTQNSGVYLLAHTMQVASAKDKNPILSNMGFYGVIQEIWDLDYQKFTIPVFRCDWIDSSGLVVDELGFTLVDLSKIGHRNDQFVLASQVKQIFFVDDPMHRGWSVVLSMPNREYNDVIGDEVLGDVIIECEPFTRGMPNVDTFDELVGELGGQNIRGGCEDIWIE
ncbi:hypothetical protein L3X38_026592 [Prunus dulcis]|uniref:Ubiquitin-like protease family profile domain-containing protein n=1 Tax=Prunus dulcis TaxID=3755 RepID=A0AAD4VNL7_PRUDU|nr:hypothetical protein L3X38_026592 [Prunus dulcis]